MRKTPEQNINIKYESTFDIPENLRMSDLTKAVERFICEIKEEYPLAIVDVLEKDINVSFQPFFLNLKYEKLAPNANYKQELKQYLEELKSEEHNVREILKQLKSNYINADLEPITE